MGFARPGRIPRTIFPLPVDWRRGAACFRLASGHGGRHVLRAEGFGDLGQSIQAVGFGRSRGLEVLHGGLDPGDVLDVLWFALEEGEGLGDLPQALRDLLVTGNGFIEQRRRTLSR